VETPLQKKLTKIADDIGKFGLISAILIFLVLSSRFGYERAYYGTWDHSEHWG